MVNFPSVETVEQRAFTDCDGLTTVNLPEAAAIGANDFSYCYALTELTLPADPPTINQLFAHTAYYDNTPTVETLYIKIPVNAVGNYTAAKNDGGWGVDASVG